MYETASDLWANGVIGSPSIPWEEMTRDERDGWARIRQAAVDASPELAEAVIARIPGAGQESEATR